MFKGKIKKSQVVPIVFSKKNNAFLEKTCPICVKDFYNDYIDLPCGHAFHSDCILSWFEKKMDCPICRMKVQWARVLLDESVTASVKK
jgi:HRD ubiquitin ligase complex, ER membrane component